VTDDGDDDDNDDNIICICITIGQREVEVSSIPLTSSQKNA